MSKNEGKKDIRGYVLTDTIAYLDKLANQYGLNRFQVIDKVASDHSADAIPILILKRLLLSGQAQIVWKNEKPPKEIVDWVNNN